MVLMDRANTPRHDAYEAYMAYMGRGKGGAKTANGVKKLTVTSVRPQFPTVTRSTQESPVDQTASPEVIA